MDVNHRQEVRRVFMEVVELPEADRAAGLDRACGGNAVLHAEVRALLTADRRGEGFMSNPTELVGRIPASAYGTEKPGTRIGLYTLVELIGEGGFGSVFLAEQEKPVARRTALKIIKPGMDTHQVIARFEAERQALVILEHPNIARVLDAGATETGRPYFVMELVNGEPIDRYCDKNTLSLRERLRLVVQVCNAVQHAHRKGIIHRDVKPSNILVGVVDGNPSAKVIDFGVAKVMGPKLTDKTIHTEHLQLIGTPEYMSPEQAAGSLDIDTRTDVYSLGVLLYELLTGSVPFDTRELRSASYDEMRRIIREVEPPRPSTRLSHVGGALETVAAARRIDARKLGAVIRGELDWIVMRAMEKDRTRRYESAGAFAADVDRYLKGEAVVAAPPGTVYLVGKFVRRNRATVLGGAAVVAALVAGMTAFAWQASIARRERDISRGEAARATANSDFVEGMLTAADPLDHGSRDVTVAELLSKASASADKTLAGQPLIEAHVRSLLANTFVSLGKHDQAVPELERALALLDAVGDAGSATRASTYRQLGLILYDKAQYRDALPLLLKAMEITRSLGGPEVELARAYISLARVHLRLSQFAECEGYLDRFEAVADGAPDFPAEVRGYALGIRASLAKDARNDLALAEKFAAEQAALYRTLGDPVVLSDSLTNLALLKMETGKFEEAKAMHSEALELLRGRLGDMHPRDAIVIENLANVHFRLKEFDRVQALLAEALRIRETVFGADSMQAARTRQNMATVALTQADYPRCRELSEKVLPIFIRNAGEKSLEYATALRIHAACLMEQGELDGALSEHQTALGVFDVLTPPTSNSRIRALQGIVEIQRRKGLYEEAAKSAELATKVLSPDSPDQAKQIKAFQELLARPRDTPAP